MKISKSLFLAFAGLGLFACSNEDVTSGIDNTGDRSLVIKLDGLTSSRAMGDPTGGEDEGTVATTLSNVAIVLSDGSKVLQVQTLTKTGNSTEWGQLTSEAEKGGYIMHEVSSHVRQVHVIGNYADNATINSWVTSNPTSSTVAAMKNLVVAANTQQDFSKVTLFGEDVALETVTGGDTQKKPTHPSAGDDPTTNTLLQAEVNLKHLVSRIEVGSFKCKNLGTMYQELTLKYFGLLNYYNQTPIVGDGAVPMTLDNVLEPTAENATPEEGKYSWNATYSDNVYSWAWDKIADGTKITSKDAVWNPNTNKKFVYQFIPKQVAGKNFNVKLYLDAKENNEAGSISAFHTVTANFTGDANFKYEPGKIYRLNFEFGEENIGPWNPSEQICVKVNVTVDNWTITDVTPTFE